MCIDIKGISDTFDSINKEKSIIRFYEAEKLIEFNLTHNLKIYDLRLGLELIKWRYRTKNHSKNNFIDYLKNKEPNLILE